MHNNKKATAAQQDWHESEIACIISTGGTDSDRFAYMRGQDRTWAFKLSGQSYSKTSGSDRRRLTRVSVAMMIGSAIEAFDFLAYGTAAALVFNKLFFPIFAPSTGTLAAFGAFAAGLLARPFGGIVFGHFGDRIGRKTALTLNLILMGVATVLIGLLPIYEVAGLWAPGLLVALRIVQGLCLGGEQGGAMLMAVEHAPPGARSLFGSLPQAGVPIGLLLSTGAFAFANTLSAASFESWGWRVPFLASSVLIIVGVFVRLQIEESPAFAAAKEAGKIAQFPVREIVINHSRAFLLTFGGKLGEVTLYYTLVVFSLAYAVTTLGFSRSDVLRAIMIGAACQVITIPLFGWIGDRISSRILYLGGGLLLAVMGVPLAFAIGSGSLATFSVAVVTGLALNYAAMYGPQSELYAVQFPTELRYSGVSLGTQMAGAVGGGLAPVIATGLINATGGIGAVGIYLSFLGLIAAISAFLMTAPGRGSHDHTL